VSRRLGRLGIFLTLLLVLLAGQALYIQYFHAPALRESSLNPRVNQAGVIDPRGDIVAADGEVLAHSVATHSGFWPWRRTYPLGALTSGVVGFTSPTYGTWALETQYNSELTAHAQPPASLAQVLEPTSAANSITLTLEPALQRVAANALAGRDGAVVALDPRNGNVLALYSNPTYDPAPLTSSNVATAEAAWKT
jgi:peptidoglycan glycosyltransferase